LRTEYVRNGVYLGNMVNPQQMQEMGREHHRDLVATRWGPSMARSDAVRQPLRVRQRLGRSLVGLGVRLAQDSLSHAEGEHLLRNDPRPQRILVLQPPLKSRSLFG
jgi:hypothetical protein